jgi:hypothetical protein
MVKMVSLLCTVARLLSPPYPPLPANIRAALLSGNPARGRRVERYVSITYTYDFPV